MYVGYNEIIIALGLLTLVGISFLIGYLYVKNDEKFYARVVDDVLDNLEKDGVIRCIEKKNGEIEILSGYKHDTNSSS